MLLDAAVQGEFQLGQFATQPTARQSGDLSRSRRALDQRPKHRYPGDPENVARHTRQLDVGGLQQLEQTVALGRAGVDQLTPIAQQIAQLAHRLGRHKAAADQAVAKQVGDPLAVLHIGLAARHVLDVVRVADHQFEGPVQHCIDRLPVDPGALHRDMRAAVLLKPLPHLPQRRRQRPKRADLLRRSLPRWTSQQTRHHRRLMYIEAAAPFHDHIHNHLPCNVVVAAPPGKSDTAMRAHPEWGQQNVIPSRRAGQSLRRGSSPPRVCRPQTTTTTVLPRPGPRAYSLRPIFIHRGARPRRAGGLSAQTMEQRGEAADRPDRQREHLFEDFGLSDGDLALQLGDVAFQFPAQLGEVGLVATFSRIASKISAATRSAALRSKPGPFARKEGSQLPSGPAAMPASCNLPISAEDRPSSSARTASVCSPSRGAGRGGRRGTAPKSSGRPGTG